VSLHRFTPPRRSYTTIMLMLRNCGLRAPKQTDEQQSGSGTSALSRARQRCSRPPTRSRSACYACVQRIMYIYIYIYISFSFSSCITAIIARTCLRGILAILLERNEVMYNLAVDLGVFMHDTERKREREREREWEKAIY